MSIVLLESRARGGTSWAAVRRARKVRISGAEKGDIVCISFRYLNGEIVRKFREGEALLDIPEGCSAVRAEHIETSGSRVSVDLIRE